MTPILDPVNFFSVLTLLDDCDPASLERVMKKPDMLKHVAGEFMTWLLSHQGLQKPGDNGFLGWSYPVLRELFVITGKALSSFKGHVSLEENVP